MDQDDDVEHLFSWLQTPELRYREFAGAREITDSVVIVQQRRADNSATPEDWPVDAPHDNTQLNEEHPQDQFPDQGETRGGVLAPALRPAVPDSARIVTRDDAKIGPGEQPKDTTRVDQARVVAREQVESRPEVRGAARGPLIIAPEPMGDQEAVPSAGDRGPFGLGAEGRNLLRADPAEWTEPRAPLIQTPATRQVAPPTSYEAPPPRPAAPPPSRSLLGGAYRENDVNGHGAAALEEPAATATAQSTTRSLDAVFGRLSGGRDRLPDPRERLRHIPGLGPPAGRSR